MLRQSSMTSDILMTVNPQHPAGGHESGRNMRVVTIEKPIVIWNGNLDGLYYRAEECSMDTYLNKYTYMKGDKRFYSKRHIHEILQETCIRARYKLDDAIDKKERAGGNLCTAALGVVVEKKATDSSESQLVYLCAPVTVKQNGSRGVKMAVKSELSLGRHCKEAVFCNKQEHLENEDVAYDPEIYFIGRDRALNDRIEKLKKRMAKPLSMNDEEDKSRDSQSEIGNEDDEPVVFDESYSEDEDEEGNFLTDSFKSMTADDSWYTKKAIKDFIKQLPRTEFRESADIVKAKCYAGRFSDSGLSFFMVNSEQLKNFYQSEQWFLEMLRMNPDLLAELLRDYKITPAKFDIHAVILEIHSERDICSNCQDHLHSIISNKSSDNAIRQGFINSLKKWGYSINSADLQIGARVSSRMSNKTGVEQQKECGCPDKVPRPFPTDDTALQDLIQNGIILAHRFVPIAFFDRQGNKLPACAMTDCKTCIRDERNFLVEIGKKLQELILTWGASYKEDADEETTVVLDVRDDVLGNTKHACPSSTTTFCAYTSLTAYARLDIKSKVCKGVKLYLTSYVTEKVNP
ncbi:uncharacterized protein LOC144453033 [Glandiceps talaboti]